MNINNSYLELDTENRYYGWLFVTAKNGNLVTVCKVSDEVIKKAHEITGRKSL
jgi:hypothetical protein